MPRQSSGAHTPKFKATVPVQPIRVGLASGLTFSARLQSRVAAHPIWHRRCAGLAFVLALSAPVLAFLLLRYFLCFHVRVLFVARGREPVLLLSLRRVCGLLLFRCVASCLASESSFRFSSCLSYRPASSVHCVLHGRSDEAHWTTGSTPPCHARPRIHSL